MSDGSTRIWPPPPPSGRDGANEHEPRSLRERVIAAIRQVYDPEIPVNIYDLGLIYDLDLDEEAGSVKITMTLTTPNCPEAETLPKHVRDQVEAVPGITRGDVNLVWDPPWTRDRMSDDARLLLGLD